MRMRHRIFRSGRAVLAVTLPLLLASCSQEGEPLAPQPAGVPDASFSITGSGAGERAFALVTNASDDDVSVIDVAARSEVATVEVGDQPRGVAITPDGSLALVTNIRSHNVSVIDIADRSEVATVKVGNSPRAVAITPDGSLSLVANFNSGNVSLIDIAARSEVATVDVGFSPLGVAITPDGSLGLVAKPGSDDVSVIDIAARSEVARLDVGRSPIGVAITPDGSLALVTNSFSNDVSIIDIAARSEVAAVDVGVRPDVVAITPDGSLALVTNRFSNNLSVVDIAARTEVATVDVGFDPRGVAITPDGSLGLVTNLGSDDVSVIDIAARSELTTVDVGNDPLRVAVTTLLEVEIDIKPDDDENAVNPDSRGLIAVAILTTQIAAGESVDFDASSVDPSTVRFGPDRAPPVHDLDDSGNRDLHLDDVDDDGDDDLVLHFAVEETGIESGETIATLGGRTLDGDGLFGRDDLRTVGRQEAPVPILAGPLTSLQLFLNHADCGPLRGGSTGSWNFFLNGVSLGNAGTVSPCQCNADEQEVTFTDREALEAWKPSGDNTISVEAVGTTPRQDIAIGFIRAELEATRGSATVAVFDATGGDASNRDICEGFVWEEDQSVFSVTVQ